MTVSPSIVVWHPRVVDALLDALQAEQPYASVTAADLARLLDVARGALAPSRPEPTSATLGRWLTRADDAGVEYELTARAVDGELCWRAVAVLR